MKNTKAKRDVYQEVTNKIINALENADTKGFKLPWNRVAGGMPYNIVSKKAYRGINVPLLLMTGYTSPVWGTYKQFAEKGIQVQKGEKGTQVVLFKPAATKKTINAEGNEEKNSFMLIRSFTVFNSEQTDMEHEVSEKPAEFANHEACEAFVANTGAKVQHGGSEAFYAPSRDLIQMPNKEDFHNAEGYYSTILHELTHWTGHKSRESRLKAMQARFGSEHYAAEELVAELGAAFLCGDLGVTSEVRDDHAKYIKSWLKVLKNDKKAIFTASSKAQKAVDLLHSLQEEKLAKAA